MTDPRQGPVRIWESAPPGAPRARAALDEPSPGLDALARALAEQELLRPSGRPAEVAEPLSLGWYVELENLRHGRHGRWLPKLLEFARHPGDRVLGLGGGLGSDWVQYARHGAEVVTACASAEHLALVRRNFELRGLRGTFLHAGPADLPLAPASIDVAVLLGLLHEAGDPAALVEEVYRVLKPGGKVLAVVPARYDADYWGWWSLLAPARPARELLRAAKAPAGLLSPAGRRFTRRELLQLFGRFAEPRVHKRHLRRNEAPHLWRWLPLSLLQRWMGRLLVYKGFKPVSAALPAVAAAA
jgi:ubiquinone/menaquinone biosynthesis C-methylase UbiE